MARQSPNPSLDAMRNIFIVAGLLFICSCTAQPEPPYDVFEAVDQNDNSVVKQYLDSGGNPNAMDKQGRSLLYIAAGPHGGMDVLKLLLEHEANPNTGMGQYTPLMNAASWVWLDRVKALVDADADLMLTNSRGQTALQCVGKASGREKPVIEYLKNVMASNKTVRDDSQELAPQPHR